jgi:hypothetical protein
MWREGDGNQRLQFVMRDYLEFFREIVRDPRWKEDFDLVFRPIFDDLGNRPIWPPYSSLLWEHMQKFVGMDAPMGCSRLCFDCTHTKLYWTPLSAPPSPPLLPPSLPPSLPPVLSPSLPPSLTPLRQARLGRPHQWQAGHTNG